MTVYVCPVCQEWIADPPLDDAPYAYIVCRGPGDHAIADPDGKLAAA